MGAAVSRVQHLDQGNRSQASSRTLFLLSCLLILAVFAVYHGAGSHPYFNLDDRVYVVDNAHVTDGLRWSTVKWSFTSLEASNWHPLTWLSHALDCTVFGVSPRGPHMTNVLLHALNAVLLFLILRQATGFLWRSFMVAALFAVHPINVEAVVWIAERKTMLSTLFFLLALAAYTRFARGPSVSRYALVFLLYALGLMSKPQVIMLPLILLLWDYWPLQRMFNPGSRNPKSGSVFSLWGEGGILRLVLEKVPLFALSGASAAITIYAQGMSRTESWGYSTKLRLANAVVAYVRYIGKALWPFALAPEYPHPGSSLSHSLVWVALAILLAISALVLVARRQRYLLAGWLWFLLTMVPMIGLIQVGRQAMADRYAYISFIGLYIILCWGISDLVALVDKSWTLRARHTIAGPAAPNQARTISFALLSVLSVVLLVVLAALSYRQIGYWRDNLTLWYHAAAVVKRDWIADDEIGLALQRMGRPEEEVLPYFYKASEIEYSDRLSNSQIALYDQAHGRPREAIDRFHRMLLNPYPPQVRAEIYQDIGLEYQELGDRAHAEAAFNNATTLRLIARRIRTH